MTTRADVGHGAPEPGEAPPTDLTRAYVRVIAVQFVSLAGLWLLQSCYGG